MSICAVCKIGSICVGDAAACQVRRSKLPRCSTLRWPPPKAQHTCTPAAASLWRTEMELGRLSTFFLRRLTTGGGGARGSAAQAVSWGGAEAVPAAACAEPQAVCKLLLHALRLSRRSNPHRSQTIWCVNEPNKGCGWAGDQGAWHGSAAGSRRRSALSLFAVGAPGATTPKRARPAGGLHGLEFDVAQHVGLEHDAAREHQQLPGHHHARVPAGRRVGAGAGCVEQAPRVATSAGTRPWAAAAPALLC